MHRLLGILSAVALMTAACVPGAPGGGGQAAAVPAKNVEPANKIVFWHAMSGINGDAVNRIVDGFNKSQNKIQVEAIFQGSYDD
jgi:sn-glycerol 3-phosphate transport system substrate-binding protein